jgi:hypothetical protein
MSQIEPVTRCLGSDHTADKAIPKIASDTGIEASTLGDWMQQPVNQHD